MDKSNKVSWSLTISVLWEIKQRFNLKLLMIPILVLIIAGLVRGRNHSLDLLYSEQNLKQNLNTITKPSPAAGTYPISLNGTAPLELPENILDQQYQQISDFFQKKILASHILRDKFWHPDFKSKDTYLSSVRDHRNDLRKMLGLVELNKKSPEITPLEEAGHLHIYDVQIPIDHTLSARALLFRPEGEKAEASVIAIPSENETPEQFAGIAEGMTPPQWLTMLLERNIVVCIPAMVERHTDNKLSEKFKGKDRRHILHRLGFIVGRTLVGLEVQQVLALTDFLSSQPYMPKRGIGVIGKGQGGMTAFYAGAVDERLSFVAVVDYFQQREESWKEPVDRMLYGQLNEFGDAEIAALIAPRPLIVAHSPSAPFAEASQRAEVSRARHFYQGLGLSDRLIAIESGENALQSTVGSLLKVIGADDRRTVPNIKVRIPKDRIEKTRGDHFEALHLYLRRLIAENDQIRKTRWQLTSTPLKYRPQRVEELREELQRQMGVIPDSGIPLNPRTRLIKVTDKYMAYDVLLDALEGVQVYGQLLVPRSIKGQVAAMICQHGLGGKPGDITGLGENPDQVYHDFGAHLAENGYLVFAPYVTVPVPSGDKINPLVRQAAAVGMMRTSIEVAKLHRVVDFLETLPFVNRDRIGYYGLSYGGYSVTWMGPLEPRLKALIISGHFNDWPTKITDEDNPASFLFYPDEDFYNWNVLNRFSHLELIAASWPRPVCVEFAERDATTTPQWHERAWQQVKELANAWNIEDKFVRDHFDGVHEIHGVGTFDFLNRWLRPERSAERDYVYHLWPSHRELPGLADSSEDTLPYTTYPIDSSRSSIVRGTFNVSSKSQEFFGMAVKLSRVGNPGDLLLRFGSQEGASDIGHARLQANAIDPLYDLRYEAKIKPVRLDPTKIYFFEISVAPGSAPEDHYIVYGPKPLGGKDIPPNFGLSYQTLTKGEPITQNGHEETFEFARRYMSPDSDGLPITRASSDVQKANEVAINPEWSIHTEAAADEVIKTTAADLDEFLQNNFQLKMKESAREAHPRIDLQVAPAGVEGVTTTEGYRVEISPDAVKISSLTSRGVMRGVYWLEDRFRLRGRPVLQIGVTVRNNKLSRRITTSFLPGGLRYRETSEPLVYTDGLLHRISHDGFNAIWVWLNVEEATLNSAVFPELNDPNAAARFARLDDVTKRANRYGLDVYIYLATGYHHHLPQSFFERHPETRGYGWGPPMCTSTESVRRYYAETVRTIFSKAPALKGLTVIYDSEGFYYCGNSEKTRQECPRCRFFSSEFLAHQLLTTLNDAMHGAGGPNKELIAWNYGKGQSWVMKLIPMLPKDIIFLCDFSKGSVVERDGISAAAGDYNITMIGPPKHFVEQYALAHKQGLDFMVKTEYAISQESIFVPYIPCMEQWYRRVARIREYDSVGWFGNWSHYGYTPSRPAQLVNQMSFDPAPSMQELLELMAERDFGTKAAPYVLNAWHHFSEGIQEYPYSDPVARVPGPIQKGPSQPLFLDPSVKSFGAWRSWQNDLKWTQPWGTEITAKYLKKVEEEFSMGVAQLEAARRVSPEVNHAAINSEWRIARTLQSSLHSTLNLIDWLTARNQFFEARSEKERKEIAVRMEGIALNERSNALEILPVLEADSRLGYASEGGGVIRGGLFTPELVRWKIGEIDDLLLLHLPTLTGSPPKRALITDF